MCDPVFQWVKELLRLQGDAPVVDKAESLARDEHYRLLIEDARSLRISRENINDRFIGLTTLMLGAQGYLLVTFPRDDNASTFYIIGIAVAGIFLCSIWSRVLNGYKQLQQRGQKAPRLQPGDEWPPPLAECVASGQNRDRWTSRRDARPSKTS